jgi:S-formylglutathione hydrolase FrmB
MKKIPFISLLICCFIAVQGFAQTKITKASTPSKEVTAGTVVTEHFTSEVLRENLIGVDTKRSISVYIPQGYHESGKSYPVIYYFHSINWSNERMFEKGNAVQPILDRAIADGRIKDFILVAANYSGPTMGSWYENSSTSGRWLDYTINEVVPYIDSHFRTIKHRDSRGLAGEFLGGYGALKFAMLYPDMFSVVYALHPVGTGSGLMPTRAMVDWKRLHNAKSFSDLWGDHYAPGFVAMSQGYLPNPNRPPFYCDFIVEIENGEPIFKAENLEKLESRFHLNELLRDHADDLRKMRGIAFDWGRYDTTQGHVYSNQAFTRLLDQLGIEHIAEEYNGGAYDKNWIPNGRVEGNMLPFFQQHLVFEEVKQ